MKKIGQVTSILLLIFLLLLPPSIVMIGYKQDKIQDKEVTKVVIVEQEPDTEEIEEPNFYDVSNNANEELAFEMSKRGRKELRSPRKLQDNTASTGYKGIQPERVVTTATPTDAETTETAETTTEVTIEQNDGSYSLTDLKWMGVIYWGGWRWTYYSETVLPGGGLNIPGRHLENGFVCDIDGYICLASGCLSKGTVVSTPFGRSGKVYDCGCAADILDVYVH